MWGVLEEMHGTLNVFGGNKCAQRYSQESWWEDNHLEDLGIDWRSVSE
jgi:hypothetical protein